MGRWEGQVHTKTHTVGCCHKGSEYFHCRVLFQTGLDYTGGYTLPRTTDWAKECRQDPDNAKSHDN